MMLPNPAETASRAIASDLRQVKRLTTLTAIMWVLAVSLIAILAVYYVLAIVPRQREIVETNAQLNAMEVQPVRDAAVIEHLEKKMFRTGAFFSAVMWMGTAALVVTVGVLAMACLGTVLLVFATRRAAMRQIQTSLAEISTQLAELKQRSGERQP